MARTLELTGDEVARDRAWEILDELAGLYGDNGGDPDGNAWLPSDTISGDEGAEVIAAGLGRMVEVLYANDAAMRHYLGWPPLCEGVELEEDTVERMKLAAEDETQGWAHYGAYGAMDSHWVFVPRVGDYPDFDTTPAMHERELECGHPICTQYAPGDTDWCSVCEAWRIIR